MKPEMRIAVCSSDENEIERICSLLDACTVAVCGEVTVDVFRAEDAFWDVFRPGCFYGVVAGYGDVKGFLFARSLREQDSDCRVILLDNTDRYAIRGLRLHIGDFLVRPVGSEALRTALNRLLTE